MADWTWRSDKNKQEAEPITINGVLHYPKYHSDLKGKTTQARVVYDKDGNKQIYYVIVGVI